LGKRINFKPFSAAKAIVSTSRLCVVSSIHSSLDTSSPDVTRSQLDRP
jgi:hypothetical protein